MRPTVAVLVALLSLSGLPAAAEQQLVTASYLCDRGVSVPATYVTSGAESVVVISVEGRQITLVAEPAASGVRYGWPSDGANYVWWSKGQEASLYWSEGSDETLLLTCSQS